MERIGPYDSCEFSGIKVAYLGTQRDLGVILEVFNGAKRVREEQLPGRPRAGERGAGPPPASSPTRGSSYPFSRAAFAAASRSTSVAWSVWLSCSSTIFIDRCPSRAETTGTDNPASVSACVVKVWRQT